MTDGQGGPGALPIPGPALFELLGRVALVTGAGGDFGRNIALGLARSGAALFVTDLNGAAAEATAKLVRLTGAAVTWFAGDVSKATDVAAIMASFDDAYDRLDILINNAGINPHQGRPEDFPIDVWNTVLATNLTAYLPFAQAAARRMIAGGRGGSIVNVSSIASSGGMGRGNLAFGVSKAGVDQLTRELAIEWATSGIRVNAIQPCQFTAAGIRAQVQDPSQAAIVARMISGIPMGRMGAPEEVVGPVLFLVSPASSMVTGIVLPVDGGNGALNPGGSVPAAS
jgi:NAD(P)-dependent dehydrogenase (short-subunit alcohol dehydrogenase family)